VKPDRRVIRTRQLLHGALLELTLQRGYPNVTVQDVLDAAQVARSTFYAHFRDKDDLLLSGFQDMGDYLPALMFPDDCERTRAYPPFGVVLFRHVGERPALAKAFLGSGAGPLVFDHVRNLIVVAARAWLGRRARQKDAIPVELQVQHLAGSLLGLLRWWIDHDFPHTPDEMGTLCQRLVVVGIEGADAAHGA
jgi:AcrR family transcriptional regulator